MNITLLNVVVSTVPTTKGSYQVADVAYKNNTFQGKVEGKKVMSFGVTADSFKALAIAQPGESYEVDIVKNDKGYNDWIKLTKAGAAERAPSPAGTGSLRPGSAATPAARSTYETPEERAARQVYIVKQSSLSNAVSTLSVGVKSVKPEDVLALAEVYKNWVFDVAAVQKASTGVTGFDDLPDFDETFDNPKVV